MLPFLRPCLPSLEQWSPFLLDSYRERRFSNSGPCVRRLERALTERYGGGQREAVLVSSCTSGLTLALLAHGVAGRVVVPAFTFPATALAVLNAGCTPVLVDVDPSSFELDALALDAALEGDPSVRAVVHVRAYGFCRDLAPIQATCGARGVPLVVDSAAALGGAATAGPAVGQAGDAEVFSLHATKVFGVGEGGVVFARPSVAAAVRRCANFGLQDGAVVSAGLNGKMSEFPAAIGLAVLQGIEVTVERRGQVAGRYAALLAPWAPCLPASPPGRPPWQTFPIRVPGPPGNAAADALVEAFRGRGVEVRRYYSPALHETPFLRRFAEGGLPASATLARQMVCLPLYSDMTEAEQDCVVDAATALLANGRPWRG